ncbi:MAG: tetratricopeptide repeat protein [Thermoguttaceae bacterium]|nr:tetratricopeptide repeat protein [Thermoguttaceae bacterium]MDW8080111.1 tetratricopeptide repeat protein [Thermoguttaceae bacterium]
MNLVLYQFHRAEAQFRRSLEIRQAVVGPNHPNLAVSWNGLGALYLELGRLEEAEAALERALRLCTQAGRRGDGVRVVISANVGKLRIYQGKYAEAEKILREAIEMREQLPADPLDGAVDVFFVSELYAAQGRFAEAEKILTRSLTLTQSRRQKAATFLLSVQLARLYAENSLYEAAEKWSTAGQLVAQHAIPLGMPVTEADVSVLRGSWLFRQRQYTEAASHFLKAAAAYSKIFGNRHASVGLAMGLAGQALLLDKRYDEADQALQACVDIVTDAFGKEHPYTAVALAGLA